ncbi:hypothetical protein ABK040_005642 [Willaertia magna]
MNSDALCQKDPVVLVLIDFNNSNNQEGIKLLKKKFENQQKGYAKYLIKKQELLIQHKKSDSSFKIPLELMYDRPFVMEILQNIHKQLSYWNTKKFLFFFKNDKEIILQCLKLQKDYFKEIISINDKFTNDFDIISLAVKQNYQYLENASLEIQNSKECILKLIEINPKCYYSLLNKFKKDKSIIEKAVSLDGSVLNGVPGKCFTNNIVKIAVSNYGQALGYVSMEFRNIYDIALTAVKQNGYAIIYVPEEILDETIVTEAIKKSGINITHIQFTKFYKERHLNLLAAQYGASLEFINEDFRNDKEIVLQAIKNKSDYSSWRKDYYKLIRDETLRKDKEICLIVVKETGCMLGAMPDEIRDDKDVVIQAIQTNEFAIEFASDRLRNDRDIAIELFSKTQRKSYYPDYIIDYRSKNELYVLNTEEEKNRKLTQQPLLSFFSKEIQEDKEIIPLAFKFDNNSLYCIPEMLRKDKDFMMKLIEIHGMATECVSDDLKKDKDFNLMAVKKDYTSYLFLSHEMKCELVKEWLNCCQQDQRGIQLSKVLIDIKKQYELIQIEYSKERNNNILYSFETIEDKDRLKELAKYNDCIYENTPLALLSDEFMKELRDIRHKHCYYGCRIPDLYP